ncbi:MAG: RNA polymerase sigma factor [Parasporobacterium sp.]|nr:RNA polymerase sigma factor [Parasporobacterium sp.]
MQVNTELVRRAKNGDTQAFGQLYELIYKELCKYAFYCLGNDEDVKDVVSETVLDAFRSINSLKNPNAFGVWMFRILSAKCKRKLASYVDKTLEFNEAFDLQASPVRQDPANEVVNDVALERAFKALNPIDRQIVSMSTFAGFNSKEIGELLGMNKNTVRTRLSRTLESMRTYLR